MADNVNITEGAGKTIRCREVGGVQYQGVLLVQETAAVEVGIAAPLRTTHAGAATATLANVSGSITSVTLQAANAARRTLIIVNDSTSILYVKFGSPASATSFTFRLLDGETLREEVYTGLVTGIWVSATGSARMTELTA